MIPLLKMRMKKLDAQYKSVMGHSDDACLLSVLLDLETAQLAQDPDYPEKDYLQELYALTKYHDCMDGIYPGLEYPGTMEYLQDAIRFVRDVNWSVTDDGSFEFVRTHSTEIILDHKVSMTEYLFWSTRYRDCYDGPDTACLLKRLCGHNSTFSPFAIYSIYADTIYFHSDVTRVATLLRELLKDENWDLRQDPHIAVRPRYYSFNEERAFDKYFKEEDSLRPDALVCDTCGKRMNMLFKEGKYYYKCDTEGCKGSEVLLDPQPFEKEKNA